MISKLLLPGLVLCISACDSICPQASPISSGPPIIRVAEDIEHEVRQAGFQDGELRDLVSEILREEGVTLAADGSAPNAAVEVVVRFIDPGMGGYVGLVRLTLWENATLWRDGTNSQVTTSTHEFVFSTPKGQIRDSMRGSLTDKVRELVRMNRHLKGERARVAEGSP